MTEQRSFVDQHGVEVATYWWSVPNPKGVVLIAHGASEHAGRYERFAQALNAAGYSAVALDHRGHGKTGAATGAGVMGPGGGIAVIDDLHELRAQAEVDGVPTFLFGHSMGSVFGLAYLTHHSAGLAGAVLCGHPSDPNGVAALRELIAGLDDPGLRDQPFQGLAQYGDAIEGARTAYDWLSRDPAEVDKYIADPLCGNDNPLTYGYLADFLGAGADASEQLASIQCPTLVIAGDQDPAAGMGAYPTALAEGLKAAGVATDLTIYEGARHELLNETNRDAVTADVIGWLDAHR